MGKPSRTRYNTIADLPDVVIAKFERTPKELADGGCIVWLGQRKAQGYGKVTARDAFGNYGLGAHRVAALLKFGSIEPGLVIDHLCRNPPCVNPDHLEPVTDQVNTLRGNGPAANAARATSCPAGHPYSGTNLYVHHRNGRQCKTCRRDRERARRLSARSAA
jgi:hypothetical protein